MAAKIRTGDDHHKHDKHDRPKPPKDKAGRHGAPGKPPKPGRGKPKGPGHADHATPDLADRLRGTADAVAGAATQPRGIAIGAVAATLGLIAGFIAVAGRRTRAANVPAAAVPDGTRELAGQPAETIGAIMAKAAARDGIA